MTHLCAEFCEKIHHNTRIVTSFEKFLGDAKYPIAKV